MGIISKYEIGQNENESLHSGKGSFKVESQRC